MGDATRDPVTGKFLPGASGNPAGRPVGVRSQTTLVKEYIENALTNELAEDAVEILAVAIKKAKNGDNAMIKLLLGDILSEVRRESDKTDNSGVTVVVKNMTVEEGPVTIEQPPTEDSPQ